MLQTTYVNVGTAPVTIASWTQNRLAIAAASGAGEPAFWSYQSGSYEPRPDWVLPLKKGFRQENFQGMNADDYGGGTPVVDVWRRDVGLAVGISSWCRSTSRSRSRDRRVTSATLARTPRGGPRARAGRDD